MRQLFGRTFVAGIFALLALRCEDPAIPTDALRSSPDLESEALTNAVVSSITLNGFQVQYNGREFTNNQTKFSYTVTGPSVQLHFRVELPSCAPLFPTFVPTNGTTSNSDQFINPGVEWHPSVGSGGTSTYNFSITYPGNVREGLVLVSVKSTSSTAVGKIGGACARIFDIGGTVFTDANANGLKNQEESGIGNITVNLLDSKNTLIRTTNTNSLGKYLFEAIPEGEYAVKVDTASLSSTYSSPTTPTTINVSIGPNSLLNDFGFEPNRARLKEDLQSGALPTSGMNVRYWRKQIQAAIQGRKNAEVPRDSLLAYIPRIRNLFLPEPFQLPDGLQSMHDILSRPIRTEIDELRQQLLATTLNYFAGLGINPELQLFVISWSESLIANPPAASVSTQAVTTPQAVSSILRDAITINSEISSGGSGGGGGP